MKRGAMKNISLAMLARQIGVGVATVDRVLNERAAYRRRPRAKCCRRRARRD